MRTKLHFRRTMLVLVCIAIVIGISITALASYQNNAYGFSINGISPKVEGSYYETIPVADFTAEVSITNKGSATSIMVLLAAYAENGQMVQAQYQSKSFGVGETSVCTFEVKNSDGRISALKAFLLNSGEELIPASKSFSISNLDMVVSAYINENGELVVRTVGGSEVVVSKTAQKGTSFSDYEIGTKFYLEYPKGEFDIPVAVKGNEYTIHVSEIYYELTAINDITDDAAWSWPNSGGMVTHAGNYFSRYNLTMHIRATTTEDLVGARVTFYLSDDMTRQEFHGFVEEDGTISICTEINQGGGQYWFSPRTLYFWLINVSLAS